MARFGSTLLAVLAVASLASPLDGASSEPSEKLVEVDRAGADRHRPAMSFDRDPAAPNIACDTSCHVQPPHQRQEMHREEACTTCHMTSEELVQEGPLVLAQLEAPGETPQAAGRPSKGVLVEDQQAARLRLKGKPMVLPRERIPESEGMVYIPRGEFLMGSNMRWEDESPEYAIRLHAYFIDRFEVTNRAYARFVDATSHPAPKHWEGGAASKKLENHPVTHVDWDDAQAFCGWADKRLPSEQEWEKAARGTDGRQYPWGNVFHEERSNNPQKESKGTEPVGSYENGKSPYGLYDMSGNVWEWIDAWYGPHPGNEIPNDEYGKKSRVSKGGSWFNCLFYNCGISAPSYNRAFLHPLTRNASLGFRCVKDVSSKES